MNDGDEEEEKPEQVGQQGSSTVPGPSRATRKKGLVEWLILTADGLW